MGKYPMVTVAHASPSSYQLIAPYADRFTYLLTVFHVPKSEEE